MKFNVVFPDSSQRFNMGGPWIGPLELNGKRLKSEFLDNNFVSDTNNNLLGLVTYKGRKETRKSFFGLINFTREIREFKILVYDSINNKWMLSKKTWEILYLTKVTENHIYYVEAFHNESPDLFKEKSLKLDETNFNIKTEKEITKHD